MSDEEPREDQNGSEEVQIDMDESNDEAHGEQFASVNSLAGREESHDLVPSFMAEDPSEESSGSGNNQEEAIETQTFAPARQHTYLPGTSHPLFPENMLSQRRRLRSSSFVKIDDNHSKRNRRTHQVQQDTVNSAIVLNELAILELQNVVLFPGSTIPIRLQNPAWIDYLGRKIDASRMLRGISPESSPDEEVRLGILRHAEEDPSVLAFGDQRQRTSWTRTGINRLQGQRLSQILQDFLLDTDDDEEEFSDDPDRSEGYSADDSDELPSIPRGRNNGSNPDVNTRQDVLIGRIGTIATITYTHEDDERDFVDAGGDSQSRVWHSHRVGQIVVTALGTGRFRIVSRAEDSSRTLLRIYKVEELVDEPLRYPLMCLQRPVRSLEPSLVASSRYMTFQEKMIQNLATVAPLPAVVYRMFWPWRLVGLIRLAIDEIADFEGLRNALPGLDAASPESSLLEPVAFSFWMASNMPFSQEEKLQILKMITPIERLRFIYKKVRRHQRESSTTNMVCCRWCGIPFSSVASMFTVGGAEGTTGAYVNEYGVIHQTITLRQVNETCMLYIGGPETRDSWFPGYSWTITSCRFCRSHLGWKFLRVSQSTPPISENEPLVFYGMSAGNVKTMHVAGGTRRLQPVRVVDD